MSAYVNLPPIPDSISVPVARMWQSVIYGLHQGHFPAQLTPWTVIAAVAGAVLATVERGKQWMAWLLETRLQGGLPAWVPFPTFTMRFLRELQKQFKDGAPWWLPQPTAILMALLLMFKSILPMVLGGTIVWALPKIVAWNVRKFHSGKDPEKAKDRTKSIISLTAAGFVVGEALVLVSKALIGFFTKH
jgi:hypothetical protein